MCYLIIDEFTLLVYCWHRYTNKQTDFGFYIMYNALFCVKIVLVAVLVLQCCPSGIHGNKTTGKKRKRRCRKVCEDEFESLKVWWVFIIFFIFLRVSIIKAQDKLVFNIPALACPITVDQLSLVKVRVQPGSLGFRVDDWVDRPLHFFKISNAPAKYGSCNRILFKLRRHHGSSARLL